MNVLNMALNKMQIYSFAELITPKKAQEYLNTSLGNRALRKSHVSWLTNMMLRDEFMLTHQGIAFNSNNNLVDGHHRLNAIVESGKTIEMLVIKNVDGAYDYIDQGAIRNNGDILNIDKRIAETLKMAALVYFKAKKPSITQIRRLMQTPLLSSIERTLELYPKNVKVFTSAPSRLAVSILLIDPINNSQYTEKQYTAACGADFDSMSVSVKAFFKQSILHSNNVEKSKLHLFSRASKAFSEKNQNITKIVVNETTNQDSINYIKAVLSQYLN